MLSLSLVDSRIFFECEMKISFNTINPESKIMEDTDNEIVGIAQNCPVQTAQKYPIYTLPTYTLPIKVVPTMYYHIKDRR